MDETPLEISCTETKALLDAAGAGGEPVTLIDCREPFEHDTVKLTAARLLPMAEIPARVGEIAAIEGPIVVYCHHGMRSAQTAQWLRANGVPTAQSMAGGIDAWAQTIDPSLPRY